MRTTSKRLLCLFVGMLVVIAVIAAPPFLVMTLAVGGPLAFICGIRHTGRQHHWSRGFQVVGYTLFYIPVFRYEVYWVHSSSVDGGGIYRPWPLACLPELD